MKYPVVSVILVNWNGKKYLRSCLNSLFKQQYKTIDIIVVDNNSSDDSIVFVQKNYKGVRIVKNKKNLGYAEGHDAGVAIARGKYILLLNVDTTVEPSFLQRLVERLEVDESIGVVQPKVVLASNQQLIDSVGSFYLPSGLLYHYGREKDERLPQYNKRFDIFSAKGVCMLIRREVIDTVGLFDSDFFAYFEETDFCIRVWLAGWRVSYEPLAKVMHVGGTTSSKLPSSFIMYHSAKNVICTYLKNFSSMYMIRSVITITFLYVVWGFIQLARGNMSAFFAPLRAIWWNIVHLNQTFKKRIYIQYTLRKVDDREFLRKLVHPVTIQYYKEQFFGNLGNYQDLILPQ